LEGEQDQLLSDQSLKSHPVRTGQLRSDFHNRVRIVADSFTRVLSDQNFFFQRNRPVLADRTTPNCFGARQITHNSIFADFHILKSVSDFITP
jgi:hypothetical protein